jgi:hypothetical protein
LSTISQKKKGPKKKNHHNNYLLDAYDDLNLKVSAVNAFIASPQSPQN